MSGARGGSWKKSGNQKVNNSQRFLKKGQAQRWMSKKLA